MNRDNEKSWIAFGEFALASLALGFGTQNPLFGLALFAFGAGLVILANIGIEGDVITPHGIVTFYAQGDATHSHASRLDFAFKNRLYIRNFDRRYSSRGLSTLGKRFAAEVVSRKGKTVLEH